MSLQNDSGDPRIEVEQKIEDMKKRLEVLMTPQGLLEHFLSDPLLYISYIAMAIYYLLFSHIHLLTLSYSCTAFRGIRMCHLNGFSWLTVIMVLYNIYQLCMIFIPTASIPAAAVAVAVAGS